MEITIKLTLLLFCLSELISASGGRKRNFDAIDVAEFDETFNKKSSPLVIDLKQSEEVASSSSSVKERISTPHPLSKSKNVLALAESGSKSPPLPPSQTATASTVDILTSTTITASTALSEDTLSWREHFMMAVKANDVGRLERSCSENNDANFRIFSRTKPGHFTFPLHYALQYDLLEAADFIINEMEFDPDALDSFGQTALTITMERCHFRQFTELLDKSDLSVRVHGGLGLTHYASSMDVISHMFLHSLQKKGLDFTEKCDKYGWTPLTYAVIGNNPVLTLWIINETPCNLAHPDNRDIILFALRYGGEAIINQLLSLGANITSVDHRNRNIFHYIAKKGLNKVIRHIPDSSAGACFALLNSPDKNGFLPAHLAAKHNNVAFISDFLSTNFDLNAKTSDDRSVIQIAIESGSAEVVRCMFTENLFDYSESFDGEDFPPILVIAYKSLKGHARKIEVIEAILDSLQAEFEEDELNDRRYLYDEFGLNIIHYAVKENDFELLKMLVEDYDFDVGFMENSNVNSPLSWAIYLNNLPMIKYLLAHGASPSERVRMAFFTLDEPVPDFNEIKEHDDALDLEQLADIFANSEVVSLLRRNQL